jgi:hypothetical protein
MTDIRGFGLLTIFESASYLIETIGLATIPAGGAFTYIPDMGSRKFASVLARNMRR